MPPPQRLRMAALEDIRGLSSLKKNWWGAGVVAVSLQSEVELENLKEGVRTHQGQTKEHLCNPQGTYQ